MISKVNHLILRHIFKLQAYLLYYVVDIFVLFDVCWLPWFCDSKISAQSRFTGFCDISELDQSRIIQPHQLYRHSSSHCVTSGNCQLGEGKVMTSPLWAEICSDAWRWKKKKKKGNEISSIVNLAASKKQQDTEKRCWFSAAAHLKSEYLDWCCCQLVLM